MTSIDLDNEVFELELPLGFARGRKTVVVDAFGPTAPLDAEDIAAAREYVETNGVMGVNAPDLKALRNTHHRLAQLLAAGMDDNKAGRLCGYSSSRVSILRADPAFAELLAYYSNQVEVEFQDFVTAASELSMDFLEHLQETLSEHPEKFTPNMTLEAIRTLADRSGNAPVAKSINVSVNTDLGNRMAAARARVNSQ